MNILTIDESCSAVDLLFIEDKMVIYLKDGRELVVPLELFPKL